MTDQYDDPYNTHGKTARTRVWLEEQERLGRIRWTESDRERLISVLHDFPRTQVAEALREENGRWEMAFGFAITGMTKEQVITAFAEFSGAEQATFHKTELEQARAALKQRDAEWIDRLGLTSTSMEAAVNSLHNIHQDGLERAREALKPVEEELRNERVTRENWRRHAEEVSAQCVKAEEERDRLREQIAETASACAVDHAKDLDENARLREQLEIVEGDKMAGAKQYQWMLDEATDLARDLRSEKRQAIDHAEQAELKLAEARGLLERTGSKRQFGLCWCRTLAGTHCVGQDQCSAISSFLATSIPGRAATGRKMSEFKQYKRSQIAELRLYVVGEAIDGVSVSDVDRAAGSPKLGDMIARNPKNHEDQWLVAAQYFADNFEPAATPPPVLPLGHAFRGSGESPYCSRAMRLDVDPGTWVYCGQPAAAHSAAPHFPKGE